MCSNIGILLAPDKMYGSSQVMIFLAITLDAIQLEARLLLDKLLNYRDLCKTFKESEKKATLKKRQVLIGILQFTTSVILPGKTFLRRLIDLTNTRNVKKALS